MFSPVGFMSDRLLSSSQQSTDLVSATGCPHLPVSLCVPVLFSRQSGSSRRRQRLPPGHWPHDQHNLIPLSPMVANTFMRPVVPRSSRTCLPRLMSSTLHPADRAETLRRTSVPRPVLSTRVRLVKSNTILLVAGISLETLT